MGFRCRRARFVLIRHLDGSDRLSSSFVYMPRWVAPPPSALRRLADSDGSPLIGPEGDPEGWKVLSPVKISGTLFDTKEIEITATVRCI